jgi:hypothetical protein
MCGMLPSISGRCYSASDKRNDLYLDLLCKMGCSLGYRMDKAHIGNTCYLPQAHADIEGEQHLIRSGILGVLRGELAIPIQLQSNTNLDEGVTHPKSLET